MIGRKLAHYEITAKVGAGGMGGGEDDARDRGESEGQARAWPQDPLRS